MKYDYFKKSVYYGAVTKQYMRNFYPILNGYARIITYTVDKTGGNEHLWDHKKNSFQSMYEGRIKSGKYDGFGRLFTYQGENVQIGYWKDGSPNGKMIAYNNAGA